MKLSTLIRKSGYMVFIHSAKSSRIAYRYSSLDLNGRYGRASNRTVAILTVVAFGSAIFRISELIWLFVERFFSCVCVKTRAFVAGYAFKIVTFRYSAHTLDRFNLCGIHKMTSRLFGMVFDLIFSDFSATSFGCFSAE